MGCFEGSGVPVLYIGRAVKPWAGTAQAVYQPATGERSGDLIPVGAMFSTTVQT
jgi:hypothetical protein